MSDDHESAAPPEPFETPVADRHLWQIQPLRDVAVVLAVLGVLALLRTLSIVVVPVLLALLLAYLFEPVIARLARYRNMGRRGAVVVILASAVALLAAGVLSAGYGLVQGVSLIANVDEQVESLVAVARENDPAARTVLIDGIEQDDTGSFWGYAARRIDEQHAEVENLVQYAATWWGQSDQRAIAMQAFRTGRNAVQAAASIVTSTIVLIMTVFFTAFFFFFIASAYPHVIDLARDQIPERHKERTLELIANMDAVIAGFIRGRLTIALLQAVVFSVGYWLIGVPASFILGPLVAALSIVPYLALIGLPVSVGLMLLDAGGFFEFQKTWWWAVGAPVGFYFVGQALDDYVWTPVIQGKQTGMDTPTILFATIAGGALFGVVGMLIAIPLAACLKILLTELFWPRFRAWRAGDVPDLLPIRSE